jgi:hypothetical protein
MRIFLSNIRIILLKIRIALLAMRIMVLFLRPLTPLIFAETNLRFLRNLRVKNFFVLK